MSRGTRTRLSGAAVGSPFALRLQRSVLFEFIFLISIKGSKPTVVFVGFPLKGGRGVGLEFGMEIAALNT